MGKEGLTFCIELCAWALATDLKNDPVTKSLIYKTIAYLFPNDLEVCRACALLVFFLDCTVEAFKIVFLLYHHPDLEYHPDNSSVQNNIRFEVIQILKKGLFFDPEFWSLLNIKTNCLKLMSDEVARDALFEIMEEDKWTSNYCVRKNCVCRLEPEKADVIDKTKHCSGVKKESEMSKQAKAPSDHSQSDTYQTRMRKRMQVTEDSVRRSRQSDSAQNHSLLMNNRLLTRQAEKILLKRRGRRPRWLLEQLAAQGITSIRAEGKKPGRKPKRKKRTVTEDTPVIEITLEHSYPDNEVEIPANLSTEGKLDDHKTSEQPSNVTTNSLLFEESKNTSSEKATESFSSPDVSVIRHFHAYAIVPVDEITSENSTTSLVKMPQKVEPEIQLEIPLLVKKSSEHLKVYSAKSRGSLMTTVMPQEVCSQHVLKRHSEAQLSSISALEQTDNVTNTMKSSDSCTDISGQSESTQATDNVHKRILESLVDTCNKSTDYISPNERGSDNASDTHPTSETVLQTTTKIVHEKTVIPTCRKMSDNNEHVHRKISTNVSVPSFKELTPQQTRQVADRTIENKPAQDRPSINNGSSLGQKDGLSHCCKLCNEECKNSEILKHALWHYHTENMCMFCPNFNNSSGALCHLKKHIKDLKISCVPSETKKSEDGPIENPNQTIPSALHKKPKPGFAQIKSKLLMRIQLKSKANIADKSCNSDDVALMQKQQEAVKKSALAQEPKEGCRTEERRTEDSSLKDKRPYNTRGLKKSEMKRKMLRIRLARKAKSGSIKMDKRRPPNTSVRRKNGVIGRKRKIKNSDTSRTDGKNAQPKSTTKHEESKSSSEEQSLNCCKSDAQPKGNKRKSSEIVNRNQGVQTDKRSKFCPEADASTGASEKQAELDTTETSKQGNCPVNITKNPHPVQSKSSRLLSFVKCPIETCAFQARLNPMFCHILSNHPGDMKALELLFHLAQKRCVFCLRKIYTPQHFCDHVVRHQGHHKHPCYNADCKQRFKTRPELTEHMQTAHCHLKAVCTFPRCTVQFDCLKLLYEHENKHYKMAGENATWGVDTGKVFGGISSAPESVATNECKPEQETTRLVNGHSNHEQEMGSQASPTAAKEDTKNPPVVAKPFSRPLPSAYLDELYLTMPKRWKGPHLSPKGAETSVNSSSKKQRCSRCSAAFETEVELQQHRNKCTSLFGFDSDDESKCD